MSDRWQEYIEQGLADAGNRVAAAFEAWRYMAPLLDRIRRRLPKGSRILELGCGAALHATLLASWGYRVTAVDNDARVLKVAKTTVDAFGLELELREADAVHLPAEFQGFDLVYSLGLIEHFDRDVTVSMLRQQAQAARVVAAVIPTKHTSYAGGITDERIYTPSGLRSMFRDAGLQIDDAFAFGNLPTREAIWLERLLPPPVYRRAQQRFGYAMNLCIFGQSQ